MNQLKLTVTGMDYDGPADNKQSVKLYFEDNYNRKYYFKVRAFSKNDDLLNLFKIGSEFIIEQAETVQDFSDIYKKAYDL